MEAIRPISTKNGRSRGGLVRYYDNRPCHFTFWNFANWPRASISWARDSKRISNSSHARLEETDRSRRNDEITTSELKLG